MSKLQSERWDINHIINDEHDLIGLIILWHGRANDIDEQLSRYEFSHAEKRYLQGKQEVFRELARELKTALQAVGYETAYKQGHNLDKGFLDD